MAHEDYYYKYGDHMPDGTADTRLITAPDRLLNRGHDALVDGAMGIIDAGRAVKDFAGNMTYNPLPYGEYARSAYDGMQNLYGNALDNGMNSVIDYVNPQPDMMSGGPMSRNGYRHYPGGYNIPANASLTQEAQEARDYQGFNGRAGHPHTSGNFPDRPEFSKEYHTASIDNTPSHLIPGYNRMVNEGYDSDQGVQTDWAAKWRASSKPQEK